MFARVRGQAGVHLSSWKVMQHAHKQRVHTPTTAHKLVFSHKAQTQRTCSFILFELDTWLHLVPSAKTPQHELRHKRAKHVRTQRPDGL